MAISHGVMQILFVKREDIDSQVWMSLSMFGITMVEKSLQKGLRKIHFIGLVRYLHQEQTTSKGVRWIMTVLKLIAGRVAVMDTLNV